MDAWAAIAGFYAARGVPVFLLRVLAAWMAAIKPPWMGLRRPEERRLEYFLRHKIRQLPPSIHRDSQHSSGCKTDFLNSLQDTIDGVFG